MWNKLLLFLSSMADTPSHSKEEKRQNTFLIYIGILMSFGGLLWGVLSVLHDLYYQAIIPFSYTVITFFNFLYMYYTKNFKNAQSVQLLISLLLPFLFQLALGGFVASGAMVLWSVLAIFAAFTYKQNNTIIGWLILFIILIILSAFLDSTVSGLAEVVPSRISTIFFAINIIVVSTIIFTLFYYYVGSERRFRLSLEENLIYVQNAQKNLVESEKMASLGRLVAGVAHEINTPIGVSVTAASHLDKSCKTFVKLYEEKKVKESDFNNFIATSQSSSKIILQNLDRAANLISSFKSISVDQSSGVEREINVKEYIDSIITSLHIGIKQAKHEVEVICPKDIVVTLQAGSLAQIITNLVENALLHAFEDGEQGKITFKINRDAKGLSMLYEDSGKGLTVEEKEKYFEPFYTTKRYNGGSGLGTHIIYNLVKQSLKGKITIIEKETRGLSLEILIPVKGEKNV